MKKNLLIIFVLLVVFSCSQNNFESKDLTNENPENVSLDMNKALSQVEKSGNVIKIESIKRKVLVDDIVHYTLLLKVGANEFDRIAIHRVIREKSFGIPICNTKGLMMLHGSPANFEFGYLPSILTNSLPSDQSMAIFLAKNNLDVWGIDMRYALLPKDITDFSFLKNWDLSVELKDIDFGLSFARSVRSITGGGKDKMILTGVSFGAFECYAMANAETQKPKILRNISAILPVEIVYKFDPQYQNLKNAAYVRYQDISSQMQGGIYANFEGLAITQSCALSKSTPDDPSPIIPGFTNKQALLFMLSSTFATSQPPIEPFVPYYHYLTGIFDENNFSIGLKYVDLNVIYDLSLIMPVYDSQAKLRDFEAVLSDSTDVPYDDHLSDITIPVFYIGSAGGFGKYGLYTLNLLGSTDIKSLMVQEYPDEYAAIDYGHADLMWAANAKNLVWTPMLDWIKTH